jgi:hypothetical protein
MTTTTLLFRWAAVVQAGTEKQCWVLLDEIKSEGRGIDKCVLPAGRSPSRRRIGR